MSSIFAYDFLCARVSLSMPLPTCLLLGEEPVEHCGSWFWFLGKLSGYRVDHSCCPHALFCRCRRSTNSSLSSLIIARPPEKYWRTEVFRCLTQPIMGFEISWKTWQIIFSEAIQNRNKRDTKYVGRRRENRQTLERFTRCFCGITQLLPRA